MDITRQFYDTERSFEMGGNSSGKGGSKQKQTTVQTSAPPSWALPLFLQGASDATRIYNSGKGGNVYQGRRVADLSDATRNAISGLQDAANAFNNPDLTRLATGQTSASQNLADMASGQYLRQGNPYYRDRLNNEISTMAAQVNSQMSGAGRYGSGANADVLARNASSMLQSGLENDYNRTMQNMLAANGQIDAANENRLNAAGSYFRNQSVAHGAALGGGQLLDRHAQDGLEADWQKWSEEDNREWNRLNLLQQAASGFSGNYGTQSGRGQGRTQQAVSPWQTARAVGDTLGGLFGKSDIRAKENMTPAGQKNGFRLYDFNYTGKPERYRGVIAQDILKTNPEAVKIDPADGLYCVDYARLGLVMERLDSRP